MYSFSLSKASPCVRLRSADRPCSTSPRSQPAYSLSACTNSNSTTRSKCCRLSTKKVSLRHLVLLSLSPPPLSTPSHTTASLVDQLVEELDEPAFDVLYAKPGTDNKQTKKERVNEKHLTEEEKRKERLLCRVGRRKGEDLWSS